MAISDPIADMLTRIRNANSVGARKVNVRRTKICLGVADALKREGYITDYVLVEDPPQGEIRIELKYGERGEKLIQELQRVSKPGCRRYQGWREIPFVLDGLGTAVVSTSHGVLSDRECREKQVGGEVLCTIW